MGFDLYWSAKKVGSVSIESQGLYLRVSCAYRGVCQALGLYAQTAKGTVYIGLCIPEGDCFGITRRIPAEHLQELSRFYLAPKGEDSTTRIPVSELAPFAALEHLENARFLLQDKAYLIIARER